jgi:chorismate mutase
MSEVEDDPTIRRFREEIAAVDREIVDAVNTRLELVARLKSYKASQGVEFVDPEQERRLVGQLLESNRGPLSSEGLRELIGKLLELTKREVR